MADKKISELTNITGANLADTDEFVVVDTSASETKAITYGELKKINGNLSFGDNDKAIFGAGSDLQIYHSGSDSFINETGVGDLKIQAAGQIKLGSPTGEFYATFNENSDVVLWYDNAAKLATTSTGVDVTGTVTADGLTVDGNVANITLNNTDTTIGQQRLSEINFDQNDPDGAGVGTVASIYALNRGSSSGFGALVFQTGTASSLADRMRIEYTGDISFYEDTGTTPKMVWKAADERLGIGTSSPDKNLHIEAEPPVFRMTNLQGTSSLGLSMGKIEWETRDSSAPGVIAHIDVVDSNNFGTTFDMAFATGQSGSAIERLRIDSSGNVILNNSPASTSDNIALRIKGGTSGYSNVQFADADDVNVGMIQYNHASNYMQFTTNDSERMRINSDGSVYWKPDGTTQAMTLDASGNLLVGTTDVAPASTSALGNYKQGTTISGGSGADGEMQVSAYNQPAIETNRNFSDGALINFRRDGAPVGSIGVNSSKLYIGTGSANIRFRDDLSAILPTDADGSNSDADLDLGYSSVRWRDLYLSGDVISDEAFIGGPTDIGYKFHLLGDAAFERTGTTSQTMVVYRNGNGNVGSISTSGSSTAYNTSSDYRLKEDVQPMVGASDRVLALNPVNFAWKADGTRVDGFLAHEAQEVVPEAVTGTKDAMREEEYEVTPAVLDDDGNVVTEAVMGTRQVPEYQGIDQSKLVPLLTAALQEALTKIEALEARVAALEA